MFLTSVFCTVPVSLLLKYIKLQKDNKIKLLSLRKSDIGSSAIICSHKSFEIFFIIQIEQYPTQFSYISSLNLSPPGFCHLFSEYSNRLPGNTHLVWISQSKFWCLQSKAKTSTVYTDLHVAQILTTLSSFKDLSTVTGYAMFSLKISPQITATFNWKNFFFFGCAGSSCCTGFLQGWCTGFSLGRLLLFRGTGSRCTSFRSYSTWAQ